MLELVFAKNGIIGNDMFGIFDPAYDHSIPQRHQDIEKAKSLLKQAGHQDLAFELVIADVAQGVTQAAQVYAQQASAAGIKVSLRQVTETELYGPNYLKWPASVDYWVYNPYFMQVSTSSIPGASYNETHFTDPTYAKLYRQAEATPDVTKRNQIAHEMDKIYYDKGGYVIPYFAPTIDGYAKNVHGASTSKVGGSFNNFDLKQLWVD
jgi:peptide/nickel transport system substrate-binding protein